MAEYKEIHGTKIRNYTTNPDNPIQGEVWYNETDKVLKFQYPNITTAGSWRTGNNMNTARQAIGGMGTQTSALAFGGYTPGASVTGNTESWSGSSWTEVNNLNTARAYLAGTGLTNTACLAIGGSPPRTAKTEDWNGSNWTEVADLNTARQSSAANGSTTSALQYGGSDPSAVVGTTEEWSSTSDVIKVLTD